jgi:hypothetical protein
MNYLLLDEIFPAKTITGIMGLPQSGKTLYALEQAFYVTKQTEKNFLFISTEETNDFFLKSWYDVFASKYSHKPDYVFNYCADAEEFLHFFGIEGKLELGEKNEFAIKNIDINKSLFMESIMKSNIGYVVIDSVTTVMNPLMQGGRQNLPLRSGVEELFFSAFNSALRRVKWDVYIFTTNHISFNPTMPFQSRESIVYKGGKIIGHYTKNLLFLEVRGERLHGHRVMFVVRYPTLPAWEKRYELLINEKGFNKITHEELELMRAEKKK